MTGTEVLTKAQYFQRITYTIFKEKVMIIDICTLLFNNYFNKPYFKSERCKSRNFSHFSILNI